MEERIERYIAQATKTVNRPVKPPCGKEFFDESCITHDMGKSFFWFNYDVEGSIDTTSLIVIG